MICLTPKPTKKISEIIGVSLWTLSSPNHNPLNYAILGVFENKTNATSHPNIGLLKTAIEEKWNKMPEEFILKACKSFRRYVATINEKMASVLSKFTVLYLSSYFDVYFFKSKFIFFFFYNRFVYYHTIIFVNLLPYLVS